jgi:hypothetical protein
MKLRSLLLLSAVLPAAAGLVTGCSSEDQENLDQSPHVFKKAEEKAERVADTGQNIRSINMALDMYKNDNDGKAPATKEEAKAVAKVSPDLWIDKATGKELDYDPATGTVSLPK